MNKRKRTRRDRLAVELFEARSLLAIDGLVLTEAMAANRSTLADEDGDFSDWFEIHNASSAPVNLRGWSLTDDVTRPRQWSFPDETLAPWAYRVIFASGKDRTTEDAHWHTNFKLNADGDQLALVNPDGDVIATLGDQLPRQTDDVSFGLPVVQSTLIGPGPGIRFQATTATQPDRDANWTSPDFNDATWSTAEGAIGFDRRTGIPNASFELGDLSAWETLSEVANVDRNRGGAPTQGSRQALLQATEVSVTRFSLEAFLGLARNDLNTVGPGNATRGSVMKRELTIQAGDVLELDWNFLTNEPTLDANPDFAFLSIIPGGPLVKLAGVQDATQNAANEYTRETGYRTFRHTFAQAGTYTLGVGVINEENRFVGSGLAIDNLRINGDGALEDNFTRITQTNLGEALQNTAGSLRWRRDFQADDPQIQSYLLRLRYDDGVVVYLNGNPVVRQNAPQNATWTSSALSDRLDGSAFVWQGFLLPREQVLSGVNTLAIEVLKSRIDDPNLVLDVELLGILASGETPVFLTEPTPGLPNVSPDFQRTPPVQFSVEHGLFDSPFQLVLASPVVDATIRYTLDGSPPTPTTGLVYSTPLTIQTTQTVRALAIREGMEPSEVATQSYLFPTNVAQQDGAAARARGFPASWGPFWGDTPADYAMDRRIVGQNGTDAYDGLYAKTLQDDLRAIPTMSLVMDMQDLFGQKGIYSEPLQRGLESERPTSVEYFDPLSGEGFQVNAGIRVQGGVSRILSSKMSFRLLFKEEYGAAKLEFPLFGEGLPSVFDSISLRSSSGEHLVGIHFLRDEFARQMQDRTGNLASHGTFVHLYINGLYWGLYNPVERVDGQFAANYRGGDKSEYDVLNAGDLGAEGITAIAGSIDAWNTMMALAKQVDSANSQADKTAAYLKLRGQLPDGTRDPQGEIYLNTENYIDYLITNIYLRNTDWPIRNYYMFRRRGSESTGFEFQMWDAEFSLDKGQRASLTNITRDGPGEIFFLLQSSEAFRVEFRDRVQVHFSPGGAFYVDPAASEWDPAHPERNVPASIYMQLAAKVASPLGPEIGRWGDETARNGRLFLRHTEWQATVENNRDNFFPTRSSVFLADLIALGFYRPAPVMLPANRLVQGGTRVQLRSNDAELYYTLDGSDPRRDDGSLSPTAIRYSSPFSLAQRSIVTARSRAGSFWSALARDMFYTTALPASAANLRITEVDYNPHESIRELGEADVDNDEFEFIELRNTSDQPIEMAGVQLSVGAQRVVSFEFGEQILAAGQYVVIPKNVEAFASRYVAELPLARGLGADPTQWSYVGRLSNSGDTLSVWSARNQAIDTWTYDDRREWPQRADGLGSSLEALDETGNVEAASRVRASLGVGGSPGLSGVTQGPTIRFNEILAFSDEAAGDAIELFNYGLGPVDLSNAYLTDQADDFRRFQFPAGTILPARSYLVLREADLGFGLSSDEGETLFLTTADARDWPAVFVDVASFTASEPGVSWGLSPDGQGRLFPLSRKSWGEANADVMAARVVLSEANIQPGDPDRDGALDATSFEFVELTNRATSVIDLGGWRLSGDVQFDLPGGTQLGSGQALVVVPFDPVLDPTRAIAFRLTYNAPENTLLVGPWQGTLADRSGEILWYRPVDGAPPGPDRTMILVDRMTYASDEPWATPLAVDGKSLHRESARSFGDLPSSWQARRSSPGTSELAAPLLGDYDRDGAVDVRDIDAYCAAFPSPWSSDRDYNADGVIDLSDLDHLVTQWLHSRAGDANLDGLFNSRDLVLVFQSAEYEDELDGNSTWSEGDWNCDRDVSTHDLVRALTFGGYLAEVQRAARIADSTEIASAAKETANETGWQLQHERHLVAARLAAEPAMKKSRTQ